MSASQTLLQLNPYPSLRTLCILSSNMGWLSSSLRNTVLPNLQHIVISYCISSVADFDPLDWAFLDEYFSTCCPGLLICKLVLSMFECQRTVSSGDGQIGDPAVRQAIEVTVRSQMARTIRSTMFSLILTDMSGADRLADI